MNQGGLIRPYVVFLFMGGGEVEGEYRFASRYVVFQNVDGLEFHISEEKEAGAKASLIRK